MLDCCVGDRFWELGHALPAAALSDRAVIALPQCRGAPGGYGLAMSRQELGPAGHMSERNVKAALRTQLSGVTASNRRRTSDVFTPTALSSAAAGSGGRRVRIWASTCWAVTWVLRRLGLTAC